MIITKKMWASVGAVGIVFVGSWILINAADNNSIIACVNKLGSLRIVASEAACRRGETPLSWNKQGPRGDKGDSGAPGSPSWNEERIATLEARIAELENPESNILMIGIRLWDNYHPTQDRTQGTFIDVSNATSATLHFSWQGPSGGHTCQYAYLTSNDGVNVISDSTFLYFPGNVCEASVNIPIAADYVRIDAWTPPSGTLNASLELIPKPSITQDNFNSYANGSIVGQGEWESYVNGDNFLVQDSMVQEGTKALHNNTQEDSVVMKAGTPRSDGKQAFYVKTEDRSNWGLYEDGNVQFRIMKGGWGGSETRSFAAVSLKSDGNAAYYDPISDDYINFATYNDNEWTLVEIEWRSSDGMARYRVNSGAWTDWKTFTGAGSFVDFDHVGMDFNLPGGSGGVYYDTLK